MTDLKGYLLAGMAGTLWGLISLFGKILVNYEADPSAVLAIRAGIAFVTLAVILLFWRPQLLRIGWKDIPFFAAFGLFCVAASWASYLFALKYTTVTTAVVIGYTYPGLVAILATVFLGEQFNRTKAFALALSLVGMFFVAKGYNLASFKMNLTGILLSLVTSVSLAGYNIVSKRAVVRYGPWTLSLYGFGFGALWLLMLASPGTILSFHLPTMGWMTVVAWAWIPTVLAYALYLMALKHIEASKASIICTLEPVSAIALACLFLGETVSVPQLLGAALVIAAVITGISINPTTPSTPQGQSVTFTATGAYSDGSTGNVSGSVTWASSNTSVATLNASGIASSLAQGSTTVTASANGVSSNSATLTVTAPVLATLTITPSSANVLLGSTQQFSASGILTDGMAQHWAH